MSLRIEVSPEPDAPGAWPDPPTRVLLEQAVRATFAARQVDEAELSLTLVDDEAIAALNARYLGHDGPTDVISFALHEPGQPPLGDVYIGRDEAARQAEEHDVPLTEELARLAIHGTLHVLGLDHPEDESRVQSPMWELQERILTGVLRS